ncbi:MAG: cytochrome c [Stellaceae bacterium]
MSRKMLPLGLLMVAVLAPLSGRTQPLTTLKSVTVDLPDSGRMFPGPGSDAINNNCLACHSAGMVLNQPALPKSAWQAEVTKMINIYKAPVSEEDVAAIVDYLSRMKAAE